MAIDNMNDGVGKKIVEALKMQGTGQANGEVFIAEEPVAVEQDSDMLPEEDTNNVEESDFAYSEEYQDAQASDFYNSQYEETSIYSEPQIMPNIQTSIPQSTERQMQIKSQLQFQAATQGSAPQSFIDSAFNQSVAQNLGTNYVPVQDDFEYPANVAVLKQLIAKLPTGVSKQTGALIIKQTMEALGISMGSVLQEAKQVQETLSANSKECQNSIVEYRKQIGILEAKAQNYQRQASIMNDIINLFIQTR